ncbi:hypothetical protein Ddye_013266 [Dipteronia dyeriana]|uniref:RNase H type-1 domain-containing protein n=1 Tax=Dipteronia dyeriana TaxID=168575 RepID=A0AAE0CJH0_9ROSI|nr:hypothetical protein Ddye_013266 [Dipteronia dyeriana]
MCKSKANDGLRISRIQDKNKGLLAKWLWRFGVKEFSLWKKVVCERYEWDSRSYVWNGQNSVNASHLIRVVSSLVSPDGSARGKPGPSGIGGVLRNSNSRTLCLFSLFVGSLDSNSTKIMAIHKALVFCVSNSVISICDMVIVSESKIAISWSSSKTGVGSIKLINLVYDIIEFLLLHNNFKVIYNSRASNSLTDSLAKMGSSGSGDRIV